MFLLLCSYKKMFRGCHMELIKYKKKKVHFHLVLILCCTHVFIRTEYIRT